MIPSISDVRGIGPATSKALADQGIYSVADLAATHIKQLTAIPGFSEIRAAQVIDDAAQLLLETDQTVDDGEGAMMDKPTDFKVKKKESKYKKSSEKKNKSKKKKLGKAKKTDKKVKDKAQKKAKKPSGKVKSDKSRKKKTDKKNEGKLANKIKKKSKKSS